MRDHLVALAADPAEIAPAQLPLRKCLNDQQSRRVSEHLHHACQEGCPLAIERGPHFLSSLKIETQEIARIRRDRQQSNARWSVLASGPRIAGAKATPGLARALLLRSMRSSAGRNQG